MPNYVSFCRSLGTTSFRRKELNKEIESQLKLLIKFWDEPKNEGKKWSYRDTQKDYYDFMKSEGFVTGDAPNKDKDAREKTSGLVALGLITEDRHVTSAGKALLKIVESENFADNNLLGLSADGYLYLKQLLKTSFKVNNDYVRPFLVMVNALCKFGKLSSQEFWLLSLAINQTRKQVVYDSIQGLRDGTITDVDSIIWGILSSMSNYQEAESLLLTNTVTESIIMEIGINRDGGDHDKPYFGLYNALIDVRHDNNTENALKLFNAVNSISKGCRPEWKRLLFNKPRISYKTIQKSETSCINIDSSLFVTDEIEFKKQFFKYLHLIKAKHLLDNYADLNKRVLKTTNAVRFVDNTVSLDIIPHCFFDLISDELESIMFEQCENLHADLNIEEISNIFNIKQSNIVSKARELYHVETDDLMGVHNYVEAERYSRFNQMIDEKFTDEKLVMLMTYFENRSDEEIQSLVTNNADVPTIFEYVLAITWYKISGRQGKILDYMNLSLDADLLPITHAAGGHEDIAYKYEATAHYPKHTLLLEATLTKGTNQRHQEMEPVSRHLGTYLLTHDEHAYCLFVSTSLDANVLSDFRGRKSIPYRLGEKKVDSMKIISCETAEIKYIIENNLTYVDLYPIFEAAYQSKIIDGQEWYEQEILNKLRG